jgi:hypothetical protein
LEKKEQAKLVNRIVSSSADGHDAKTLRVHQLRVAVANDLNVVYIFSQMFFFFSAHFYYNVQDHVKRMP